MRTIQNLEIISFICRGFETIRNFLFQNIKCVRHFELPTRIVITICVWFDCDRRPSWIKTMHRTKPRWNPNSFRFSANEEKIKRISGWFLSTSLNWCYPNKENKKKKTNTNKAKTKRLISCSHSNRFINIFWDFFPLFECLNFSLVIL